MSGVRRVCAIKYTHYRSDPRVRREAEALAARGDDVTVLALREPGRPPREQIEGVRLVGVPVARYRGADTKRYVASYARFFAAVGAHLTRRWRRYDLVHVHTLPEAMVFSALVPKLLRRPVLLDVGDLSTDVFVSRKGRAPATVRWAQSMAFSFADRVITVHEPYQERVAAQASLPRAKVDVVLNAPDDRMFQLRPPSPPGPAPVVLYHGLLAERYGLATALRGIAAALPAVPDVRFEILGDGDFRPRMLELIDELGLGDVVSMSPGAVPIDEIPRRIAAADVGLVPLDVDRFTDLILPTKLLELVRMGKPVIVTRNRVIERYFADDSVWFVEPGRPDDIARALSSIVADPAEAVRRAERAQRFFELEGWEVNRARFLAIVDELVPCR
jgi:glycosyltransferase involved in cell wall biosynthesis